MEESYTEHRMTKTLSAEQLRYEQHGPLVTLLKLSVGPLIYMVGIAIHDAIDLLLIAKAYSETEVTIVGFAATVTYLCMSVTIYFSQACVARTSSLIGANEYDKAAQVIADLYRLAFIVMLFFPIICYFIASPLLQFMGCTAEMAKTASTYLIPILCFMPFIALFQLSCGLLQSEGRSILSGIMQLTAFVLDCGFIGPILFFAIKVDFKHAGFAFALSQALPGMVLFALIFSGKFKTITSWKNLAKKPIYETYEGIKIASPYILNVIMGLFPPLVMINFFMKAAFSEGLIAQAGPCSSVFFKLQPLYNCFSIGFAQGFLAPGSYSWGARQKTRVKKLFFYTLGITLFLQLVLLPVVVAAPVRVAKIWLDDPATLDFAHRMLPIPFYTNWTTAVNETVTALLMCMGFAWTAMSPSLVRGVFYIVYSCILYYTNKTNSVRMLHTYNANDLTILLLDAIIVIKPLMELYGKTSLDDEDDKEKSDKVATEV